jgi:hypothetical protein
MTALMKILPIPEVPQQLLHENKIEDGESGESGES